jgi:hypothetical protein
MGHNERILSLILEAPDFTYRIGDASRIVEFIVRNAMRKQQ